MALFNVTNSSPTGGFELGNGTANILNVVWRSAPELPPYEPHYLLNDSPMPSVIHPNVRWQSGSGYSHTLIFGGAGDWKITNSLTTFSLPTYIAKQGPGTLVWSGPSLPSALGTSTIGSPVRFLGGTVILRSALSVLNSQTITNNGDVLQFDAPLKSQVLSGPIRGGGRLKVSNGTLTLASSQSDFSGNVELAGGTLVVGSQESGGGSGPLGAGGILSFSGGTLQFSAANAFDYSSRFSVDAGQDYRFDTAGQVVTFSAGLNSPGGSLTKTGEGTLILASACSFDGAIAVNNGTLIVQGLIAAGSTTVFGGALGGSGVFSGPVALLPGTALRPGSSIGTLTISNSLTLGGSLHVDVNKSLTQSNDLVVVTGSLINDGGSITVYNLGPALMPGDRFVLFNQPIQDGAAMTVVGGDVVWLNNLGVDGSITVDTVSGPPILNAITVDGGLEFSWSGAFKLQVQTNSLGAGLGGNWTDYPGGSSSPVLAPINTSHEATFFRLISDN